MRPIEPLLSWSSAVSASENRRRGSILNARCYPEEADEIRDRAASAGISVSEFMRCAALGRKIRKPADIQLVNELRKLGGLQKYLFNESGGQFSKEYSDVLKEIVATLKRIEL